MKILYTFLLILFTGCIITHSELSLSYALIGLDLWYNRMVPALFPFMILSGIMIRMNLTASISRLLYPILKPLYHVSENGCYAMLVGFLCGFPMGAKTISDLLKRNMISAREAEYLLAFCNNIGPVYFASYVLPLLGRRLILPYITAMYGIPLLYGLLLRYTCYRDICYRHTSNLSVSEENYANHEKNLLDEIDASITSSIQSILNLGGYMILFNLLNTIPHILFRKVPLRLAPLFEITGGLRLLDGANPLYSLILLPFGGLSCIAQTNSCIKGTPLSVSKYTIHKIILMLLTGIYYLGWFLLFPESFLR